MWPLQRLAELRAHCLPEVETPAAIEARLFGLSGLLPSELPRQGSGAGQHVRQLWDTWWRDRDALAEHVLPRSVWRLNGIRPANHPHRRLALASHWLADRQLPDKILHWCSRDLAPKELTASLLTLLLPAADDFWDWRFTLFSAPTARPLPLLGETRVTDLAVNVILPWAWGQIPANKPAARARLEQRYLAWPAAQDNAILKLARQRLLGGTTAQKVPGAAAQQGLMQIVRDFCDRSNALCEGCKFPGIMEDWLKLDAEGQRFAS